jgi:hypothetical protein
MTQEWHVDEAVADDGSIEDALARDADDDEVLLADDDVLLLEEVEAESVLPMWEPTGDHRVDAALDLLNGIDPDDVHQHAAVFTEVHQQLRAALSDLDARS